MLWVMKMDHLVYIILSSTTILYELSMYFCADAIYLFSIRIKKELYRLAIYVIKWV